MFVNICIQQHQQKKVFRSVQTDWQEVCRDREQAYPNVSSSLFYQRSKRDEEILEHSFQF